MTSENRVIQRRFGRVCQHNTYLVDETLNTVECGLCGKELNPIWVLTQFANKENRAMMNIDRMSKIAEKADKKNRCKCEHCKQMTRVQRI